MVRILVVVPSDTDPPANLGRWLRDAGLELDERRCDAGDPLPDDLGEHDGLLVLGGPQSALDDEQTSPELVGVRRVRRIPARPRASATNGPTENDTRPATEPLSGAPCLAYMEMIAA